MTVPLSRFIVGLLLLWVPRHWMRRGVAFLRRRKRSAESTRIVEPWREREPGDPRVRFGTEFMKFRNYIDLLRAGAGGVVLSGGMGLPAAILIELDAPKMVKWQVLGVRAFVLLVGLLVQAVRYEKNRVSFYPPIFYIAGLSIALCGSRGAAFAFMLIWAVNVALPNARTFLTTYAVLLGVFGYFFAPRSELVMVAYAGFLCFLPVLLSLMANRPLMAFARKATHTPGRP